MSRQDYKWRYRGVDELPDSVFNADTADEIVDRFCEPDENGCLLWQGTMDQYGRGRMEFWYNRRPYNITNIHRFIFQCYNGRLKSRKEIVMHLCGVKHCCSNLHLIQGDHKRNAEHEKILKQNAKYFVGGAPARSEAKTRHCVRLIKRSKKSNRQIAKEVGFHPNTVARYRRKVAEGKY